MTTLTINNFVSSLSDRGGILLPTNTIYRVLQVEVVGDIQVLPIDKEPYREESFIELEQHKIHFIRITVEWLKKLGFHLEKVTIGFEKHYFNGEKFEVILKEDGTVDICLQKYLIAKIEYVHELQNFWKIVCKKDLEIVN